MKSIVTITFAAMLATGAGAVFATPPAQVPPPTKPPAVNPVTPHSPRQRSGCASYFPTFSQMDAKHQGAITKKEAEQVPSLEQHFAQADTNHNGKLSKTEYTDWVKKQCGPGLM